MRQAERLDEWVSAPGELGGTPRGLTHLYTSPTTHAVHTAAPLAHALSPPLQGLAGAHEVGGLSTLKGPAPQCPGARTPTPDSGLVWPAYLDPAAHWEGGFEGLDDHPAHTARRPEVGNDSRRTNLGGRGGSDHSPEICAVSACIPRWVRIHPPELVQSEQYRDLSDRPGIPPCAD